MCSEPSGAVIEDPEKEEIGECPHCGGEVVVDKESGDYCSTSICSYSPLSCKYCGCRDCDQSC